MLLELRPNSPLPSPPEQVTETKVTQEPVNGHVPDAVRRLQLAAVLVGDV